MTTTFSLDPKFLDDSVSEQSVQIAAEAFAYFRDGEHLQPSYTFYLHSVGNDADLPLRRLNISRSGYDGHHGDLCLRFQRANVIFMPVSDGDKYQWGSSVREFRERYLRACEDLYVRGNFLKGDAAALKNYGVKIL